jgi:hypothetical protein
MKSAKKKEEPELKVPEIDRERALQAVELLKRFFRDEQVQREVNYDARARHSSLRFLSSALALFTAFPLQNLL